MNLFCNNGVNFQSWKSNFMHWLIYLPPVSRPLDLAGQMGVKTNNFHVSDPEKGAEKRVE